MGSACGAPESALPRFKVLKLTETAGLARRAPSACVRCAPAGGSTQDAGTHYYFDYGKWGTGESFGMNFAYLCRAYFYGDSVIPRDAVYGEHSAILVFRLDEAGDALASVKHWAGLLQAPAPTVEVMEGSGPGNLLARSQSWKPLSQRSGLPGDSSLRSPTMSPAGVCASR